MKEHCPECGRKAGNWRQSGHCKNCGARLVANGSNFAAMRLNLIVFWAYVNKRWIHGEVLAQRERGL